MKNHKKSKSKILTIAILPSLLLSLESKKRAGDICKGTPDTEFEQDRSIGSGSTFGNGQTDTHKHTHTHTHTHTHIFSKTLF